MKKISANAFLSIALSALALLLAGAAGLQFLVDPLLHFHTPWFGLSPVLTTARYQNAGCLRRLPYDSVILGNSMCENFEASWFDEAFGGKTAKLPISGSIAVNWAQELELLKARRPAHILMNIDYDGLSMPPERANYQLPEYLYDDSALNDVNYLLNLEILAEFTIPTLIRNAQGDVTDLNRAYEWSEEIPRGRDVVMESFYDMDLSREITYSPEEVTANVRRNLALLEPYLDGMPDTEFVFFVSPWSMMYWHMKIQCGQLDTVRAAYTEGLSILTERENVTVYFWDDDVFRSIAADLDNYSDLAHYSKEVSRLIAQRITAREGILTHEEVSQKVNAYFDYLSEFPYDTLFEV